MRKILLAALAVLGCGNDNVHHLDDGGADAPRGIDATAPDSPPAPGVVTVTVTTGGEPSAGNTVYFQNADSSMVAEVMTDGSGVASATMAPGGFVTVIEPQPPASLVPQGQGLATFAGVKPGDQLRDDLFPLGTADSNTFNITVPTDPAAGVLTYTLATSCAEGNANITPPVTLRKHASPHAVDNNPPVSVSLFGCNGSADMAVFTEGLDQNILDAFVVPNVTVANGSDITLAGTYQPVVDGPMVFTDVPPEFVDASIEVQVLGPHGSLAGFTLSGDVEFSGGSGSNVMAFPPAFANATALTLERLFPAGDLIDEQVQATWGTIPASLATDVGAIRLRSWASFPQVDTATGTLEWVVAKDGATPDYVVARVNADRSDPANETEDSWTWAIAAPGTSDGHIAYPTLPTDVFDFNFRDTDGDLFVSELVGVQSTGGYDAARATVFDAIDNLFNPELLPAATGSIYVQVDEEEGLRAGPRTRSASRLTINGRAVRSAARAAR